MKKSAENLSQKKWVLGLIFILCLFFNSQSQIVNIPYTISNNTNCSIIVEWAVYDYSSCTTICDTSPVGGILIAANTSTQILTFAGTCSDPNQGCNLSVTITNIGGTTGTWGPFDNTSFATNPNPIGPVGTCVSSAGMVIWGQSNFTLQP